MDDELTNAWLEEFKTTVENLSGEMRDLEAKIGDAPVLVDTFDPDFMTAYGNYINTAEDLRHEMRQLIAISEQTDEQ